MQLYDYIFQQAMVTTNKPLLNSRTKWVKVHSNTPHVHSLVEAMRAPEVAKMLQGAKFAREGVGLDKSVSTVQNHFTDTLSGVQSDSIAGSTKCWPRMSFERGMVQITLHSLSIEAQLELCSSQTTFSGRSFP